MTAVIPDPGNLDRTQARPDNRVASFVAGQEGAAQAEVGNEISRLAAQESAQINVTQAQDALNQLAKKRADLTLAPPNADGTGGGFRNLTGGKVLAKDSNGDTMLKTYPGQLTSAMEDIGKNLSGPAARIYNERAQGIANQFNAEVMVHVMEQTDAYHKSTLEDTISTNQATAALSPTNPVEVQAAIKNIQDAVKEYSNHPRAGDTRKLLAASVSGVHENVIGQAIAQGNSAYALEYFNQHKKEMLPQDILQAEGKLDYSTRQDASIAAVSSAVDEIGWKPGRPLPTLQEVEDASIAKLGGHPDPKDRAATIQEASRRYNGMVQAHAVTRENAIAAAQQEMIRGNGQIPLSAGAHQRILTYAPDYASSVPSFMASLDPAKEINTNIAAYNMAVTHPDEVARMSDADFLDFQTRNFAKADREKIANLRADYLSGTPGNSAAHLDTSALNEAVNTRLASIDINPHPKASDLSSQKRVDAVKHFITEDIYSQQAQLGRKMTGPEVNARIDQLFARSTEMPGLIYGTNVKPTLAMKVGDVPKDDLKKVKDALSSLGVAEPTDDQVLNTYWKWKAKNAQ